MYHGVVYALFLALLGSQLLISLEDVAEALTHGKMTSGILIEEGVVEHQSRLTNGAVVGNESALAEICRSLVHGDHFLEESLALLCVNLNGASLLKANGEILDELALIGKGTGGVNYTLSLALHGRNEGFLGGNIGVEYDAAALSLFSSAKEESVLDKSNTEICSV